MQQPYLESTDVSISVAKMAQDAAELTSLLANISVGFSMPSYIRTCGLLPDGSLVALEPLIVTDVLDDGYHLSIASSFAVDERAPYWSSDLARPRKAIDILVRSTGPGTSMLSGRSEPWCSDVLFFILLEASSDPGLLSAVGSEVPAINELNRQNFFANTYRRVTVHLATEFPTAVMWLLGLICGHSTCESFDDDGSGHILSACNKREHSFASYTIEPKCRLVSKRDARGIRVSLHGRDCVVFEIERLSAGRCKVVARISQERFIGYLSDVLAIFAQDYPETREAIEAAGFGDVRTSTAASPVSEADDIARGKPGASRPQPKEKTPDSLSQYPGSADDERIAWITKREHREMVALHNQGFTSAEISRKLDFTAGHIDNIISRYRAEKPDLIRRKK